MNVNFIRSDGIYAKIMKAPLDKKEDIYRYELMMPFEKKWACYSVPMKAATPNGYDAVHVHYEQRKAAVEYQNQVDQYYDDLKNLPRDEFMKKYWDFDYDEYIKNKHK